jgi:hypothetical protein
MTTTQLPAPWHVKHASELNNRQMAMLLEAIAADAERAPDISPNGKNHRYISAVGLADILLAASDRLTESAR